MITPTSRLLVLALAALGCTPAGVARPDGGRDGGRAEDASTDERDAAAPDDAGPPGCLGAGACGAARCEGQPCDGAGGTCGGGVCVPAAPSTELDCADGLDDDADGLTDCDDPDCDCGLHAEVGALRVRMALGGSGASTASGACPDGEVIVGLAGRAGEFIDQLEPVCAEMIVTPFLTDVVQIGTGAAHRVPTDGPSGGGAFDDRCPADMIVTRVEVQAGDFLDRVTAHCEALFARLEADGTYSIYADGGQTLPSRGGPGGAGTETARCANGAFTELEVQYVQYIDRLTLDCHDLAVRDGPRG